MQLTMLIERCRDWLGRRRFSMACDLLLALAAQFIVLVPLLNFPYLRDILVLQGLTVTASLAALYRVQAHRQSWSRVSLSDVIALAIASAIVSVVVAAGTLALEYTLAASRILIGSFVMLLAGWVAPRLLLRLYAEWQHERANAGGPAPEAVLLYGAGPRAEQFIRFNAAHRRYRIAGILHEQAALVGRRIRGVEALGSLDTLDEQIEMLRARGIQPSRLIVTEDGERPDELRDALDISARSGLRLARLPSLLTLVEPGGVGDVVRDVSIQDILQREQVTLDDPAIPQTFAGKVVMVTGAGGSIGSELVRQIAAQAPARLVLVEFSEFNLYQIDLEMAQRFPRVARSLALCDIRDVASLRRVFERERPQLVLHAAALKHVPMLEDAPAQAILTNVFGTHNVARLASEHGVELCTLVSTDKAVNPTNVMGCTKRWAEIICQAYDPGADAAAGATRFSCVRFGNVLDSAGSVVPLFRRQIAERGPLTVTHPDITRYFMTIPEACLLILAASATVHRGGAEGGSVFVLDMGEPVKIMALAERMIQLHGLRPHVDVEIRVTGLRPGEKLFEELAHAEERLLPAPFPKGNIARARSCDQETLRMHLDRLREAVRLDSENAMLAELARLVPEFRCPRLQEQTPAIGLRGDHVAGDSALLSVQA
ncbi:polysaccharide biosynthesis protein [Sphingomonas baiyangensis]|nr:nucleoside-diphosphate sugar epimerase/dehydratase [Sphingomonas baiyangensis]